MWQEILVPQERVSLNSDADILNTFKDTLEAGLEPKSTKKTGVVPPESFSLNSPDEIEALFQALHDFEVVLKPYRYELEELGL